MQMSIRHLSSEHFWFEQFSQVLSNVLVQVDLIVLFMLPTSLLQSCFWMNLLVFRFENYLLLKLILSDTKQLLKLIKISANGEIPPTNRACVISIAKWFMFA